MPNKPTKKELDFEFIPNYSTHLTQPAKKGDKTVHTTCGDFRIRKNGRVMLKVERDLRERLEPINEALTQAIYQLTEEIIEKDEKVAIVDGKTECICPSALVRNELRATQRSRRDELLKVKKEENGSM